MVLESLVFQRALVLDGQLWRLWTGHLVHIDSHHMLGNVAAAIMLGLTARVVKLSFRHLAWVSLALASVIGVGLLLMPWIDWYLGASGVLYGLAVYLAGRRSRPTLCLVVALLACRMMLGDGQGGQALTEAHALGLLSGLLLLKFLPLRYCSDFGNRLEFAPFRRKVAALLWAPKS